MKQKVIEILCALKDEISEFEWRVLDDKPRAALLRMHDISLVLWDLKEEVERWIEHKK
jgi:hypothetical protein